MHRKMSLSGLRSGGYLTTALIALLILERGGLQLEEVMETMS